MKKIFNIMANETQVEEVTTTKVDAKFVGDLQGIFRKIPKRTQMRFKQLPTGQLMVKIRAEFYGTNMEEKKEGFGEPDLISAILTAASGNTQPLNEYACSEHEFEVAGEGENLVLGIMEQFISSGRKGTIEPDWVAPDGRIFRCATFISSHNMEVHFCVEATEEVNKLIEDACTPEWMRKASIKSEQ